MKELNKLYLMDCMEGMKTFPDNYFDLAIVDPPYGIDMGGGADWGTNTRTFHKQKEWDKSIPNQEYFNELFRVSLNQIVWGGNYFINHLRNTKSFIVWDKMNGGNNMADCELAWTSFDVPIRMIRRHIFSGIGNTNYKTIHPTQKPEQLYKWILNRYAKPTDKIIDIHVGSGSSIIAFEDFGCDWIGFEIDEDYHKAATKRIEQHKSQTRMQL